MAALGSIIETRTSRIGNMIADCYIERLVTLCAMGVFENDGTGCDNRPVRRARSTRGGYRGSAVCGF
jgi:hypothetical protein